MGVSQQLGVVLGGPDNEEFSILGSILGVPVYWETTTFPYQCTERVSRCSYYRRLTVFSMHYTCFREFWIGLT